MLPTVVNGVPTKPDANKIVKTIANIGPGETVSYEELEDLIGVSHKSRRFETVLKSARKMLSGTGVATERVRGIGLRRLPENERTSVNVKSAAKGVRTIRRAATDQAMVDTRKLNEGEKSQAIHARRLIDGMLEGARSNMKKLSKVIAPPSTSSNPKIR